MGIASLVLGIISLVWSLFGGTWISLLSLASLVSFWVQLARRAVQSALLLVWFFPSSALYLAWYSTSHALLAQVQLLVQQELCNSTNMKTLSALCFTC